MNAANTPAINHASLAAILAKLQTVGSLASGVQEALQATPEGVAPPQSVSQAVALIQEIVEVLTNDVDAAKEAAGLQ